MTRPRVAGPSISRYRGRVLGLVVILALAAAALARVRTRSLTVFAHRGFASEAPENTVDAVRRAAERADAIEIDVRRCGSGELVCVHDETLERLTGFDRRVDETDWETLRSLTVDGASISRLEDVLAAVPAPVLVNLELKERGLAADVLEHLEVHEGPVLCSSFDPATIAELRARDDDLALAYVFRPYSRLNTLRSRSIEDRGISPTRALEIAADLECVAIHPRADLCLRSRIVSRAHRRGFDVNAWTVDSAVTTALLALVGVDGVFADSSVSVSR